MTHIHNGEIEIDSKLSQASYNETPYEDASWEVVGQAPSDEVFVPMKVDVMNPDAQEQVDPMFANYSTGQIERLDQRWHLPEHLATKGIKVGKVEEEIVPDNSLSNEELQQIITEAEERGRLQAIEEIVNNHNEKLAEIERRVRTIIVDVQKQFAENIISIEKEAVQLSLAISDKIIHGAVEINPEYIAGIVQEALAHCGTATVTKIRVSAEDMEFIDVVGISKQIKSFDSSWKFEADTGIRSGCIVETSSGEVDYQLDKAWERIRENVMKVRK